MLGKHQPKTITTKTIEPKNPNAYVSRTRPGNQILDFVLCVEFRTKTKINLINFFQEIELEDFHKSKKLPNTCCNL